MIWNGCWSKRGNHFYTVGRDKLVIKWSLDQDQTWMRSDSISFSEPITAIDSIDNGDHEQILVGTERKGIFIFTFDFHNLCDYLETEIKWKADYAG